MTSKKLRSIVALVIIVGLFVTGAGFFLYKLINRAPAQVRALNMAALALRAGNYDETQTQAAQALDHPDTDVEARRTIWRARILLKQFDKALDILDAGLVPGKYPPDGKEHLELELLRVQTHIERMVYLIGQNPSKMTVTAAAQDDQARQEVEDEVKQAGDLLGELTRTYPKEGRVYEAIGDWLSAQKFLAETTYAAYRQELRGLNLMQQGTEAEAVAQRRNRTLMQWSQIQAQMMTVFRRAIFYDPELTDSRLQLAQLLLTGTRPDFQGALDQLNEVLKLSPKQLPAALMAAEVKRRMGKTDEALADVETLRKEYPDSVPAMLEQVALLLAKIDGTPEDDARKALAQQARGVLTEAEKKKASGAMFIYYKGRLSLELNQPDDAAANLGSLVVKDVNLSPMLQARVYYYLGLAKLAGGNTRGLEDLATAVDLMRPLTRGSVAADESKELRQLLVKAQVKIVETRLAAGTLGDAPERMLQTLAVDLDNETLHGLFTEALAKETDAGKVMKLTVAAVNLRVLAGNFPKALEEAREALKLFPASEQLQAAAGLAALCTDDFAAGMDYFQEASRLRGADPKLDKRTPNEYALMQYNVLAMVQFARGDAKAAETTLDRAMKQFPRMATPMISYAELMRGQGELGAAIQAYRRAIQTDPKRVSLHLVLARVYLSVGMVQECRQALGEIPSDSGYTLGELYGLGTLYGELKDQEGLRTTLERLLAGYGTSNEVRFLAYGFCVELKEYDLARQLLELVVASGQAWPEVYSALAGVRLVTNDPAGAATALEKFLELKPASPAFYPLGVLYLKLDQPYKALELAQKTRKSNPDYDYARLLEAAAHFQMGKTDVALTTLEAPFTGLGAARRNRTRFEMRLALLVAAGRTDEAVGQIPTVGEDSPELAKQYMGYMQEMLRGLAALEPTTRTRALAALVRTNAANFAQLSAYALSDARQLVQMLPDDPVFNARLAMCLTLMNEPDRARELLRAYLTRHPDFVEGWRRLADTEEGSGNPAKAAEALEHVVALIKDSPSVQARLARLYEATGNLPRAMEMYQSIISKSDLFPDIFNNYAYNLATTQEKPDLTKALEYARKAVELVPYQGQYRDTLAWCLYLSGQYEEAEKEMQQAVAMSPQTASIYYHLGMVYLKRDKPDEARRMFAQALAVSPKFPEAQKAQEELAKLPKS